MIYGCEKCGHTYNLPIYERVNSTKISKSEYDKFMANDRDMIFQLGTEKKFFSKSRAVIARDKIAYKIIKMNDMVSDLSEEKIIIHLINEYDIPIREDKIVAEILGITRKEAKVYLLNGAVLMSMEKKVCDKNE